MKNTLNLILCLIMFSFISFNASAVGICRVCAVAQNNGGCSQSADGSGENCIPAWDGPDCCKTYEVVEVPQ